MSDVGQIPPQQTYLHLQILRPVPFPPSWSNLQNSPYNSSITSEVILMSDPFEPLDPSALSLLWKKEIVLNMADKISLRLPRLLATVAPLLALPSPGDFSQQQKETISSAFRELEYPKWTSSGPICRVSDQSLKYYRCFTCELARGSCLCECCFNDPKHLHHEFKIITNGPCYCDCGNEECLRKEHFCTAHASTPDGNKNRKDPPALMKREADIFNKQVEFLLTLGLLSKLSSDEASLDKAEHLSTMVIEVLLTACNNSFTYQRMAGELLLQHPRREFKMDESTSLLHQFFWAEWRSDAFNKALAKLLCQLYSYEPMRRRIVVEYFKLHTSEERKVIWVNPLTEIDSQYFLEGRLILKLLKSNAIPPLTLNYRFTSIDSTAGCYIQIYRAYRIMAETTAFPEILEETLRRTNFATFYAFAIIDRESRAAVNIVTKHFLVFLRLVMKTLQKLPDRREAELKIIRQSYQYIKTKEQIFNFCPERTLFWCLFSHLSCTLEQLPLTPLPDLLSLLGESSRQGLLECLERMLEAYFNLLRIENYNDYRELTSEKFQVNASNRVVVSLDYTAIRGVLGVMRAAGTGGVVAVRNCAIGRFCMLEKWVHLHRVEQIKREAITEPDARAQIATLMETGLFIKPEDQIAGTTIEVVAIFNSLLFACESPLCEVVLANLLGRADREKVMEVYREYAWLQPTKTRLELKVAVEGMVDNQPLIKEFITTEREGFSRGERAFSYRSNLSYCSRFFNDELTDDSTQRLIKKLTIPTPCSPYSRLVFGEQAICQLIKYTRFFVRFITGPHIDLRQAASLSVTFNLLLEAIIVIFLETRIPLLKEIFLELNANPLLTAVYTDYTKIIVQIFLDCLARQVEAVREERPEVDRKEAAKVRREQMMKQIRERQDRILQGHTPMAEQRPEETHQTCIICKTASTGEQPLSFLCNMRFTNTLVRNILHSSHPMLLITTCGHMIHQSCLAGNIDAQDEYGTNYHCFLCKQLSNLRVPLVLAHPEGFTQYLLTIISLELTSNPSLRAREKELTHLPNAAKLFYESIVNSIYLYYFTVGKFYNNYILPLVKVELTLLRWVCQQLQMTLPQPEGQERRLRMVEEKVHSVISNKHIGESNGFHNHSEKTDKEHIDQLFNRIMSPSHPHTHPALKQIKQLDRLNFFPLPKDLRQLSKQSGKCRGCSKLSNRTLACLLCGFKLCGECSAEMNVHVDVHLGTTVLVDLETGRYSYRYRNIQMAIASLYTNYVGEDFNTEGELPPEGEYELSQERLQKLIDEVLRDTVQSTVEEYVREVEAAPACNVQ